MTSRIRTIGMRGFGAIAAVLLIGHSLLFYALPVGLFATVLACFSIVCIFLRPRTALIMGASFGVLTAVLALTLKWVGLENSLYFRPQELFATRDSEESHGRYQRNVDHEMTMPFGDLKAMHRDAAVAPHRRHVVFQTDSLGYRNTRDYHGQRHLLVGDSFVAGTGNTQDDTLASQLLATYGHDTYSIAFPGGVPEYAASIRAFERVHGTDCEVVLFVFEGNDFSQHTSSVAAAPTLRRSPLGKAYRNYSSFARSTGLYAFMYSARQKLHAPSRGKLRKSVTVADVGGVPVAFHLPYIAASEMGAVPDDLGMLEAIASIQSDVIHIVFLPTKYRVYYAHLLAAQQDADRTPPNKPLKLIREIGAQLDIPVTDLTPALVEASNQLLPDGQLTFWSDDTHWNRAGIEVAAQRVAAILSQRN